MNVNVWDVNDAIQDLVRGGRRWTRPGSPTPAFPWTRSAGWLERSGAGQPGEAPGGQFDPAVGDVEPAGARVHVDGLVEAGPGDDPGVGVTG